MTLAALHLAGENSKMHHYKQKSTKNENLPKTAFDQENSLKISEEKKNRNIIHDLLKNPVKHKGVNCLSPINKAFIGSKNYTKQNLKKEFRSNCWNFARLELRCQVLTCSNSMKFWLVITWKLTLAGLQRAVASSKPHYYKQNVQK